LSEPRRGKPFQVTGEKIFGVLAIVVGLGLAILAGVEANIPPLVLVLLTVGVLGWVAYYFVVVRPSVTGLKRSRRGADRETE
jgi:drug/metabolite transporter (DMT)-like permease